MEQANRILDVNRMVLFQFTDDSLGFVHLLYLDENVTSMDILIKFPCFEMGNGSLVRKFSSEKESESGAGGRIL